MKDTIMSRIDRMKSKYNSQKTTLRQNISEWVHAYYEKILFTTMGVSILFAGIV